MLEVAGVVALGGLGEAVVAADEGPDAALAELGIYW